MRRGVLLELYRMLLDEESSLRLTATDWAEIFADILIPSCSYMSKERDVTGDEFNTESDMDASPLKFLLQSLNARLDMLYAAD